MTRKASAAKRATNISLSTDLIEEARRLDINISQACERGLQEGVARRRAEKWLEENREAIDSSNAWVDKHGLPLSRHRRF